MLNYSLDIEKSKEVYEYFKDNLRIKECYNNIFNLLTLCPKTFRNGKWKIAYGYVGVLANLYCRHCFIIDNEGKVIDPTIYTSSEPNTQREYYVMATFNNTDEYLNAIENDNYMPALENYLRDKDKQAYEWANEKGYIFVA